MKKDILPHHLAIFIKSPSFLSYEKDLCDDKEFILTLIDRNCLCAEYISDRLCNDYEVMMAASKKNSYAFSYASDAIKDDKSFATELMTHSFTAFQDLSKRLQDDVDIVKIVIAQNGFLLGHIGSNCADNPEVVSLALDYDGDVIQFAGPNAIMDKSLCLKAVQKTGRAIRHTPLVFRDDAQIALASIAEESNNFIFISQRLQTDLSFLIQALDINVLVYSYFPLKLKQQIGDAHPLHYLKSYVLKEKIEEDLLNKNDNNKKKMKV